MLTQYRALLQTLIPLRNVFLLAGLSALLGTFYLLFAGTAEQDKYLLPLVMMVAWSFSLYTVLCGYLYLAFGTKTPGFWRRIGYWLRSVIIRLFEMCFLATSVLLMWLSVRSVIFVLTH